jgi:hypothetical protein
VTNASALQLIESIRFLQKTGIISIGIMVLLNFVVAECASKIF